MGATSGYSGKNMIAMGLGLKLQKEGYRVGYMKTSGPCRRRRMGSWAMPMLVQDILGQNEDPTLVTPVVVDQISR